MIETVERFLKEKEGALLSFLSEMISLKSPSAGEKPVAERVKEEMTALGYENVRFDSVGNVIGELGRGEKAILLSSHMDAAGVADPSKWKHDPYKGVIEEGKIYGRGAGDNKGALSCMIYGCRMWHEIYGREAGYRVLVGGTVLEEDADGYGMQALIEELPQKPSFVMIGKPTGGSIYRGHRGRMEVRIEVKGEGCHASAPEKGKNALYLAGKVLLSLEKLAGNLGSDPFLGKATLAATTLAVSPGKFNQVPDSVEICVDRRLTAGETYDSALGELREALPYNEVTVSCFNYENTVWTGKKITLEKYFPSWVLQEDHRLIDAAREAGRLALGHEPAVGKWTVSTDGVGSMGRHGIPTIGYGPGERLAIDDHQKVSDLLDAVRFYSAFCHAAGRII